MNAGRALQQCRSLSARGGQDLKHTSLVAPLHSGAIVVNDLTGCYTLAPSSALTRPAVTLRCHHHQWLNCLLLSGATILIDSTGYYTQVPLCLYASMWGGGGCYSQCMCVCACTQGEGKGWKYQQKSVAGRLDCKLSGVQSHRQSSPVDFSPSITTTVDDDRFYVALFSSLEQTYCTRMWFYRSE